MKALLLERRRQRRSRGTLDGRNDGHRLEPANHGRLTLTAGLKIFGWAGQRCDGCSSGGMLALRFQPLGTSFQECRRAFRHTTRCIDAAKLPAAAKRLRPQRSPSTISACRRQPAAFAQCGKRRRKQVLAIGRIEKDEIERAACADAMAPRSGRIAPPDFGDAGQARTSRRFALDEGAAFGGILDEQAQTPRRAKSLRGRARRYPRRDRPRGHLRARSPRRSPCAPGC